AVEWKASASIAGLPVMAAATYLKTAMARLATIATYTTFFEALRRGCLFRVGNHSQLQVLRLTAPALIEARRISASSLACSKTRAGFRIPLTWFVGNTPF